MGRKPAGRGSARPFERDPRHLKRLRRLTHKRSEALRERALGVEARDLVAKGAPPWQVHQYAFAILALESEPVDPRL
nr:hypothetical protein [Glycomyces harbinensis]